MDQKVKGIRMALLFVSVVFFTLAVFLGCGKDDKNGGESDAPQIVGCNNVKYQGYTYSSLGCAPGIASFDTDISQNGHSASFHVTCSNGCIKTVSVRSGSASKTIVSP
jgi:hypothetical protein